MKSISFDRFQNKKLGGTFTVLVQELISTKKVGQNSTVNPLAFKIKASFQLDHNVSQGYRIPLALGVSHVQVIYIASSAYIKLKLIEVANKRQ